MDSNVGRAEMIIERMNNIINEAPFAFFSTDKVTVDKEEMLRLLDSLSDAVETEMKVYREVNDKKARIINEARMEAEEIRYEAEQSASRIRVTKRRSDEVFPYKEDEMAEEELVVLRNADDIYGASLIYTDEMLTEVDHLINDAYANIENEYQRMQESLKKKMDEVSRNKTEILEDLISLSKNDRYSQILELSQLLSNELYEARKKARAEARDDEKQMQFEFKDDDVTVEEEKKRQAPINPDRTAKKLSEEEIIKVDPPRKEDARRLVQRKNGEKIED